MEIEKYLAKLKREYMGLTPDSDFVDKSFERLELPVQKKSPFSFFVKKPAFSLAFTLLFIFIGLFSLIQVAQASLPGEPLYPVKKLYENLAFTKPQGKKEKTERRANEIIDIVNKKKGKKVLKETIDDYKKTIDEAKEKLSTGKDLEEVLSEQEKRFEQAIEENPESKEMLDEAIKAIRDEKTGEDVKGEIDGKNEKSESEDKNSGEN